MVFLGGWRSKYLYQQGCPMLPATVARGYVAFSRHEKKISKTNQKTYNIQHTTLYKLFLLLLFLFRYFRGTIFHLFFYFFIFVFAFAFDCFFSPKIRAEKNKGTTDDLGAADDDR